MADIEEDKRLAAEAAAELVEAGMTVGLGTGSTVAYLLLAVARRRVDIRYVATPPATAEMARSLRSNAAPFSDMGALDLAIDGANQVDPAGWLVKGRGGAHAREKIVAGAADGFVVIVSSNKLADALRIPVPLELLAFGADATLRAMGDARLTSGPPSPDGGGLAGYFGPLEDPAALARRISTVPGVVGHGLFLPHLVSKVLVGQGQEVQRRRIGG